MASDIDLLVENKNLTKTAFKIQKVIRISIHYDKYDPTRVGDFIEYQYTMTSTTQQGWAIL